MKRQARAGYGPFSTAVRGRGNPSWCAVFNRRGSFPGFADHLRGRGSTHTLSTGQQSTEPLTTVSLTNVVQQSCCVGCPTTMRSSTGRWAKVLAADAAKAAGLAPLHVALRQRAGEVVRAPPEVLEVAADICKRIEEGAPRNAPGPGQSGRDRMNRPALGLAHQQPGTRRSLRADLYRRSISR